MAIALIVVWAIYKLWQVFIADINDNDAMELFLMVPVHRAKMPEN